MPNHPVTLRVPLLLEKEGSITFPLLSRGGVGRRPGVVWLTLADSATLNSSLGSRVRQNDRAGSPPAASPSSRLPPYNTIDEGREVHKRVPLRN